MYISNLRVKNYRSLKDVRIDSMSRFTVFFGDNDTGKSNILSFLELIFSTKTPLASQEAVGNSEADQPPTRPGVFWRGQIADFIDNFYKNQREVIEFSITIRLEQRDLANLPEVFLEQLPKNRRESVLVLNGRIMPSIGSSAEFHLDGVTLNRRDFYKSDGDSSEYLGAYKLDEREKLDAFNAVMDLLEANFRRIPPERYLLNENEEYSRDQQTNITPANFKNWMLHQSLDREGEAVFRTIGQRFEGPPFNYGRLSLARIGGDEIEILVETNSLKLPIGRKGSGVQQILMILGFIAESRASIVGIEELEINLSPSSQQHVFDSLKALIEAHGPISQVLLTSHSRILARRRDVKSKYVSIDNGQTIVSDASGADARTFWLS